MDRNKIKSQSVCNAAKGEKGYKKPELRKHKPLKKAIAVATVGILEI